MGKTLGAAFLPIFFLSATAWADVQTWAGLTLIDFSYEELATNRHQSREKGLLPFFDGGLRASLAPGHWVRFRGQILSGGMTDYSGTDLHTFAPITARDIHDIYDFDLRYEAQTPWGFSVFIGTGLRVWDRFLSYGTGYREVYRWSTLPVGARGWFARPEGLRWLFGWEVTVRPMLWGTLDVLFSETFPSGVNSGLALGNKTGYRLALPVESSWDFGWGLRPKLELWYDQSEIGESNLVFNATPAINGMIREPASITRQMGVLLGLRRDF